MIGIAPAGDGSDDRKVWHPSNNKIHVGGIELGGDSMKRAGCVAGPLIGKRQTLTQVK